MAILDASGTKVVEYKYNAWGRPIYCDGTLKTTLGTLNPFRYRGYVYDEETGLYYLRSRYYSPEWGRFINADNLIGVSDVFLCNNMYCHCNNSTVILRDSTGNSPELALEIQQWAAQIQQNSSALGPYSVLVYIGAGVIGVGATIVGAAVSSPIQDEAVSGAKTSIKVRSTQKDLVREANMPKPYLVVMTIKKQPLISLSGYLSLTQAQMVVRSGASALPLLQAISDKKEQYGYEGDINLGMLTGKYGDAEKLGRKFGTVSPPEISTEIKNSWPHIHIEDDGYRFWH